MTPDSPKVSVVIPTLNAGPGFGELLERIESQEGDFDREVIVVDSGSTDGTDELAQRYGALVHRVPKEHFNHGATRNLGISLARGEYVVLTVQDAVPLDGRWLATMVEELERDGRVAGVYSRQVPHPQASALTRVVVNSLATAQLERREQFAGGPEQYRKMLPEERRELAAFNNVSSCLRHSVWEKVPFEETNFGEDIRWGKKVVEAGYKIVYEPRSVVFHSHERGAMYDLRRHYVDQRVLLDLFRLEVAPNLKQWLIALFASTLHFAYLLYKEKEVAIRWAPWCVLLAAKYTIPAQIGTYLGGRSGPLARRSPWVFAKFHRFLSKGV